MNLIVGLGMGELAYAAIRGRATTHGMAGIALAAAATGAVAGLMVYVVRVISRELGDMETDVYLIGAPLWAGVYLGVALGRRSESRRVVRGAVAFLAFSVSAILAASVALIVLVKTGTAGF